MLVNKPKKTDRKNIILYKPCFCIHTYTHIFQIHIEWPSKIRSKGVFFVKKELEKISENEECMLNSLVCGDIHSNVLGIEMQFNFCVL